MKFVIILSTILLASCVSKGTPIDILYEPSKARLDQLIDVDEPLLIIARDSRPYVLTGDKARTFIGLARFYGAPISINLKNNTTVAQMVAGTAKAIMLNVQPSIVALGIIDQSSFEQIIEVQSDKKLTLLFDLKEWKVDTPGGFGKTAFYHDISLEVRNHQGETLAITNKNGKEVLKASVDELNGIYGKVLETLLSSPKIVNAMNTGTKGKAVSSLEQNEAITEPDDKKINDDTVSTTCSVSQILIMKESGLSEEQIQAACN